MSQNAGISARFRTGGLFVNRALTIKYWSLYLRFLHTAGYSINDQENWNSLCVC